MYYVWMGDSSTNYYWMIVEPFLELSAGDMADLYRKYGLTVNWFDIDPN